MCAFRLFGADVAVFVIPSSFLPNVPVELPFLRLFPPDVSIDNTNNYIDIADDAELTAGPIAYRNEYPFCEADVILNSHLPVHRGRRQRAGRKGLHFRLLPVFGGISVTSHRA